MAIGNNKEKGLEKNYRKRKEGEKEIPACDRTGLLFCNRDPVPKHPEIVKTLTANSKLSKNISTVWEMRHNR